MSKQDKSKTDKPKTDKPKVDKPKKEKAPLVYDNNGLPKINNAEGNLIRGITQKDFLAWEPGDDDVKARAAFRKAARKAFLYYQAMLAQSKFASYGQATDPRAKALKKKERLLAELAKVKAELGEE
jgi:hypothetical protein